MMKRQISAYVVITILISLRALAGNDTQVPAADWPKVTRENKPWTRWWWMGSAVNPADLARELKSLQQAGVGGVEITPIYGVKGYEKQFIEYLSPKWMEVLQSTVTAAQSMDMGVDMATGTGWCFVGPNVSARDAT